jgi:hypothetical protein
MAKPTGLAGRRALHRLRRIAWPKHDTGYGVVDTWVSDAISRAFRGTGLIDIAVVGDSNAAANGSGWLGGLCNGWRRRGGQVYSTGLVSAAMTAGSGFNTYHWKSWSGLFGDQSGAPQHLDVLLAQFNNHQYAYLTASPGIQKRVFFYPDKFGAKPGETWRYWCEYGNISGSGGSFDLRLQLNISPYTVRASSALIPCNVGDNTQLAYVDGPVPTLDEHAVGFTTINPNAWFGYLSVNRFVGGLSTNFLATYGGWLLTGETGFIDLLGTIDKSRVGAFLMRIRQKQMLLGYSPKILISLIWGANDTSVSGSEFKTALAACMDWFVDAYQLGGGQGDELGFLLMADHRVDDEGSQWQLTRDAFSAVSDELAMATPRVASWNLQSMFTAAEATANGWYPSEIDHAHLTAEGYGAVAARGFERVFGI